MAGREKLAIEVLLREEEIAAQLQQALARRFLDEKFFYWLPPSVQAWVELTRSVEYRNSNRALQVLAANAASVARMWPGAQSFCSLGCGEGSKDRILLRAYAEAGKALGYVAADFSQALLELALAGADGTARTRRGVKFDVADDAHLRVLSGNGQATIYAVLGNTLGAFGALHFPARLREIMAPGDRALFDGEIFDEAGT
ncbi:MAG: L-histidine N(alpha)-methyltransferase, partial [Chlamydiota bacterium]